MTLSARDLTIRRGARTLTTGLSFDVPTGEALILRGPNGAGKTTLLRTLAGFLDPGGGQVTFEGVDRRDRSAWLDVVAYAGHADALKPQMSVAENLAFWARLFGEDATPAMEALDLNSISQRRAGACSAGQKRRLGLARLMVTGRPLWLLDEPTVSLDTASKAAFAEVLTAHLAKGGAALLATHEADLITARTLTLEPAQASASAETDPFLEPI